MLKDRSPQGMPDDIASAFWIVSNGELYLCRADGKPLDLDSGGHKCLLRPYEDAVEAARRLLKKRHGTGNDFNATKIKYPPTGGW